VGDLNRRIEVKQLFSCTVVPVLFERVCLKAEDYRKLLLLTAEYE